ncbi:DUF4288 domain-containing protein [Saccharopolyspora taberi]|uniref:DUF4288 domain-containing protein n=1 Tax=Saccharopolyspora taberi TaxID=60895 RepID=A0ABN3VLZ9_9PSEU
MSTPEEVGSINIGPGTIDPRDFQPGPGAGDPDFYLAVLVTEATTDDGAGGPLYEESFVLLKAESEEEAREKAAEYGKQQETSYRNENDELVSWKLKHVVDVRQVEDATFDDGSELYSRFFRGYQGYRSFEPRLGGEEV